jgi:pimeloyl-ACP methyl ester carboxylesterase
MAVPTERQSISFKDPMPRDVGQGFHESILAERYRLHVPVLPGCGGSCIPRAGYYKKTIVATIGELVRRPDLRRLKTVGYNHGTRVAYNYTDGQRYARRNSSSPMQ